MILRIVMTLFIMPYEIRNIILHANNSKPRKNTA